MISVPNSVPTMAILTQLMRLTPATASATRENDNGRDVFAERVGPHAVRSHT